MPSPTAAVGARVRALREAMGLSLRDLAERSGVSAPMLSQVERGETSPTLAVAAKIAAGLELTLSQLLRLDEGQHVVDHAPRPRAAIRRRGGHAVEELTPPLPGQRADVSLHALEPGAAHRRPRRPADARARAAARPRSSSAGERRRWSSTATRHELREGDSVTFDADLPHHFENEGDADAVPRRDRRRAAEGLTWRRRCSTRSGRPTRSPTA